MFNIILAEFKHETNTFSTQNTDMAHYRMRRYVPGQEMLSLLTGTATEVGGFIDVLAGQPDVCLLPVITANAMPAGPVTRDVFDDVCARITGMIRATPKVDGVLLCLHGAMVTTDSEDGEGDLLEAIRQAAGDGAMLVATLDLHANITKKMECYADVLINFDYYPHTDMFERGTEAARIMLDTLRGRIRPVMRCVHLPMILPLISTSDPVMRKFVEQVHELEQDSRVLSVSISHGFLCADIHELGMTVIAVTDQDPGLAECLAGGLADQLWQDRSNMKRRSYSAEEAIAEVEAETQADPGPDAAAGPVIFADLTDNPGGGSTCDGTHILRAMIEHQVKNAAVALIYDPESVMAAEKAGVGHTVALRLGGKSRPELLGPPIECMAYVKLVSDGRYKNRGPMDGGVPEDLGKSAVVVIGDISVIISAKITQPYDTEIFYAHGIDPRGKNILLLKSTHHFRAAFGPLARRIIPVEVPGLVFQNPSMIPYARCRRPIFPLDDL